VCEGLKNIANFLKTDYQLVKLALAENGLGEESIDSIADAVAANSALKELYLGGNLLTENSIQSLAKAIKINSSLEVLILHKDDIPLNGKAVIFDALMSNFTLLSFGQWTDDTLGENIQTLLCRNKKIPQYRQEKLEIICCLTSPNRLIPDELVSLLVVAYYNTLVIIPPPLPI
jgi:hypothetical protein